MFDENSNQTIDRNEFQAMLEFFEAAITQQKVDEIVSLYSSFSNIPLVVEINK